MADEKGLVVHEWGVLIRQNSFPDTVGAANELIDDLPGFVGLHSGYTPQQMHRPWRKPVLHFYGKEQKVSVEIHTPTGRPVAYWPKPVLLEETFWQMGSGVKDAVGMKWEGELKKERPDGVPVVAGDHWWNKVREVEGLWFDAGREKERFVFYEGTGRSKPAIDAEFTDDHLTLRNTGSGPSGMVLVIANDGEQRYMAEVENIGGGKSVVVQRKRMFAEEVKVEDILDASRRQWLSYGMTEQESEMIASVWRDDLWQSGGFLVISRMPQQIYEKYIFPIKIEPKPDELVRAAVVFDSLSGVDGRLQWLPEIEQRVRDQLPKLGSANPAEREKATSAITSFGDLAAEVLGSVEDEGDLEVKMRVKGLLGALKPKPAAPLPSHYGKGSQEGRISFEDRRGPKVEIEGILGKDKNSNFILEVKDKGRLILRGWSAPDAALGKEFRVKGYFVSAMSPVEGQSSWIFQVE